MPYAIFSMCFSLPPILTFYGKHFLVCACYLCWSEVKKVRRIYVPTRCKKKGDNRMRRGSHKNSIYTHETIGEGWFDSSFWLSSFVISIEILFLFIFILQLRHFWMLCINPDFYDYFFMMTICYSHDCLSPSHCLVAFHFIAAAFSFPFASFKGWR